MSNEKLADTQEPVFFIEVQGDDWIQAGRIPGSTFDFSNLPDGIVNLYAAQPAPQERRQDDGWIDFNERVPDKLTPVIVMYAGGEMWAAIWSGEYWDDGLDSDEVRNITHWRPMPPMPDQE